jgi:biopolymer transport protein ExbB
MALGAEGDTAGAVAVDSGAETPSLLRIILTSAGWIGGVIGVMSIISVTVIIDHFLRIRRATMVPDSAVKTIREMIEARQFKECIDRVSSDKSMFADVLTVGLRHGRHGFDAMQEAASERANSWRSRLFRRVEYLNIIGNLCPLLGLLGTVLGMIQAFAKMNETHGAYGPEDLAGGISLALVSTFLGLIVAIVSLGFFGICRNRVDSFTVTAHAAVEDLLEYFRPATQLTNGGQSVGEQANRPQPSGAVQPEPVKAN